MAKQDDLSQGQLPVNDNPRTLWKVRALVEPIIEWEKLGLESLRFGDKEIMVFEGHTEGRSEFSVKVISHSVEDAKNRAELLLKSFLAVLALQAQRQFKVTLSNITPIQGRPTRKSAVLIDAWIGTIAHVVPRFEDLNLTLLQKLSETIQGFAEEVQEDILKALNSVYNGMLVTTNREAFLCVYDGLNYLVTQALRLRRLSRSTTRQDAMVEDFVAKGVLSPKEVESWKGKLRECHDRHREVEYGLKEVSVQELDEMKAFFQEFLGKYLEYRK